MSLHLLPITPRLMTTKALAEAHAHVLACRERLTLAPGRDEPCEQGLMALHAIETALDALGHAGADLSCLCGSEFERAVDVLHDLASDVTGAAKRRMEDAA